MDFNSDQIAGGASKELIQKAEADLGIIFPDQYREFLMQYGALFGSGRDIAGLFEPDRPDKPPMWQDVVEATKRSRHASGGFIPESYLVISGDGMDTKYYIDANKNDSCPVIALGPGDDYVILADSFNVFVNSILEDSIDQLELEKLSSGS